jgi:putative ABC transport system ATP-binding protein
MDAHPPPTGSRASAESAPARPAAPRAAPPQIECIGVEKSLPSGTRTLQILHGIDLAIEAGELVAILGPSGSGKSTLLGLLAGLDRPSGGSIRLEGRALESLGEDELALLRRRRVGFVFQSFHLLSNLTARENVLMPLELTGFPGARERADEVLAEVGLAERAHHYPAQLSGGEQQRVALARAFAPRPRVLFADEPTGNLDSETGARVLQLLLDMRARHGTTLVLVTHDPAIAARADRELHLASGRLVR